MDTHIARYLNDHLTGSSNALPLIRELGERHHEPAARAFFTELHDRFAMDLGIIRDLLAKVGGAPEKVTDIAAAPQTRAEGLRLLWERVESGKLGMFEALDILAVSVQSKKLLWAVCLEVSTAYPEWNEYHFAGLEMEAILQREGVEKWRKRAASDLVQPQEARLSA